MKKGWLFALLVLVGSGVYSTYEFGGGSVGSVTSLVKDDGSIEVHFCPAEECEPLVIDFLRDARESIYCAWYDFNLVELRDFLEESSVDVKIVVDEDNAHKVDGFDVVIDSGYGLMHNKFCVVDGRKVFTGSMNPTLRDTTKNNNNLILISSEVISSYYSDEFFELWNKGDTTKMIRSPVLIDGTEIAVYFCPEEECADKVVRELRKAERSIHFLTFSFTHAGIANAILLRMQEGVSVQGVYERSQLNEYTTFDVLKEQRADVKIDGNKYNMHHKFFVIDGNTVITGSMNPTAGGDQRNDENLVIINNERIAAQFEEEFGKVYTAAG